MRMDECRWMQMMLIPGQGDYQWERVSTFGVPSNEAALTGFCIRAAGTGRVAGQRENILNARW